MYTIRIGLSFLRVKHAFRVLRGYKVVQLYCCEKHVVYYIRQFLFLKLGPSSLQKLVTNFILLLVSSRMRSGSRTHSYTLFLLIERIASKSFVFRFSKF